MIVTAELPGLDEKDFQISLTGDVLTIKGEKKLEHEQKNGNGHYRERRYGSFSRALRLPFELKDEKIDAAYQKGRFDGSGAQTGGSQKGVRLK
jgi:HSP20 family protein